MSTLASALPADPDVGWRPFAARLEELGELSPLGRPGGQGRVYRPMRVPPTWAGEPIVVKLYRRPPSAGAVALLAEMIGWSQGLDVRQRTYLHEVAAWPTAVVTRDERPVGIVMRDVSGRFEVPFVVPSGREQRVLLSLEHLLGGDDYLQLRGLGVRLDTTTRAMVAERIAGGLAFLHRHGIVASDIAPNNLLVRFGAGGPAGTGRSLPAICFIDCDSTVFQGRQALAPVETTDWRMPAEFAERAQTRAADAYKLGLVILRLFARSHDSRLPDPRAAYLPAELRDLVARSLSRDAANRPPAGEWQRALGDLIARGGLNERCPGPPPATPRIAPARPRGATRREPALAPRAQARSWQPSRPPRRRRAGTAFALFVIALVVFALILARLVASMASSLGDNGGFGPPSSSQTNSSAPYSYSLPTSPDGGSGLR